MHRKEDMYGPPSSESVRAEYPSGVGWVEADERKVDSDSGKLKRTAAVLTRPASTSDSDQSHNPSHTSEQALK